MKGEDLYRAMGYIDDALVAEALEGSAKAAFGERRSSRSGRFGAWPAARRWGTVAAAVAVLCLAGLGIWGGPGSSKDAAAPAEAPEMLGSDLNGKNTQVAATEEAEFDEAEPESAEEPAEMADSEIAYAGAAVNDEEEKSLVSNYAYTSDTCYAVPKNGEVNMSMPLRKAMEAYGDEALYRVWIDVFAGEKQLDPASAEMAEVMSALSRDHGLTTAIETFTDADGSEHLYPTLHLTFEQLQNFPPDADYGYMLFLFDERAE